jgi:Zinc finger, C3HC4 type (RING finger)
VAAENSEAVWTLTEPRRLESQKQARKKKKIFFLSTKEGHTSHFFIFSTFFRSTFLIQALTMPGEISNQIAQVAPHPGPRELNPGRGGRQQGQVWFHRTEGMEDYRQDNRRDNPARGSGSRGGGRGRGESRPGRNRHNRNPRNKPQVTSTLPDGGGQPPGGFREGIGTSGDRSAGDARETKGEEKAEALVSTATEEPDDGEICFICASKVEHISVAPCNHRTCHICALRLRALYKTKACAHCRVRPIRPLILHLLIPYMNAN